MRFGEIVKQLREAQRLTQSDLACLMCMPSEAGRVTIAQWESGDRTPNDKQLKHLAACLGYWSIGGNAELRREIVERALAVALDE